MQNELKPISFYEDRPDLAYDAVEEFLDVIFVPYAGDDEQGACSLCCLSGTDTCLAAACTYNDRHDGENGYFILKPTSPAMATAGFSYGSMGEEVL